MQQSHMASTPIAQNPDIRFLGRLLGDVIRAYGGDALFRRIEYIRSASVDRARGIVGIVEAESCIEEPKGRRLRLRQRCRDQADYVTAGLASQ